MATPSLLRIAERRGYLTTHLPRGSKVREHIDPEWISHCAARGIPYVAIDEGTALRDAAIRFSLRMFGGDQLIGPELGFMLLREAHEAQPSAVRFKLNQTDCWFPVLHATRGHEVAERIVEWGGRQSITAPSFHAWNTETSLPDALWRDLHTANREAGPEKIGVAILESQNDPLALLHLDDLERIAGNPFTGSSDSGSSDFGREV